MRERSAKYLFRVDLSFVQSSFLATTTVIGTEVRLGPMIVQLGNCAELALHLITASSTDTRTW